ncbi:NADH:ubiquinone oxidoreductase subunit NDUFA12 [Allosphingosinicella flava]|uniref:NADH:ubiquinone oxidoreductase subunit NDUFA12 n=1 Tax=Allosphingosinicella flava TaxID=2771430 RepID=A0A7T2GKG6_9SPHN|nr:NADH:ubiquinone oxidoreductase subunit NDUFA12 [Sphingosinicella flava]QPQ55173.1 NADH:ubiquinone oxidoreductase subunit NDUFA12 [Sphingosinicella flava]
MLKKIFTWWTGATIGTALHSWRTGRKVGTDSAGNVYYEGKKDGRRWVIYAGENDASAIPPEWHAWIHRQIDGLPDDALPPVRPFQKPATGNLTGTAQAYRPSGALERGGRRQAASGDYEAWTPN